MLYHIVAQSPDIASSSLHAAAMAPKVPLDYAAQKLSIAKVQVPDRIRKEPIRQISVESNPRRCLLARVIYEYRKEGKKYVPCLHRIV
jgi:hypothetical protein